MKRRIAVRVVWIPAYLRLTACGRSVAGTIETLCTLGLTHRGTDLSQESGKLRVGIVVDVK
jgi:hypothetical protein